MPLWIGLSWCCLFPAGSLQAQSSYFIGAAPEVSRITVEHTKVVTIGGGSSSSTSAASGLQLAASVFGGLRSDVADGRIALRGEIEVIIPSRSLIEGTIQPTNSGNPHDVWPGRWDFQDRFGLGAAVRAGLRVGDTGHRTYALLGTRAMWSEFATGGTNPETGVPGEDRARFRRWPAIVGAGVALNTGWPLDFRATYSRSLTNWVISQPDLLLDYDYVVSSVTFSARVGTGPR